jgi:hypothetical protein
MRSRPTRWVSAAPTPHPARGVGCLPVYLSVWVARARAARVSVCVYHVVSVCLTCAFRVPPSLNIPPAARSGRCSCWVCCYCWPTSRAVWTVRVPRARPFTHTYSPASPPAFLTSSPYPARLRLTPAPGGGTGAHYTQLPRRRRRGRKGRRGSRPRTVTSAASRVGACWATSSPRWRTSSTGWTGA